VFRRRDSANQILTTTMPATLGDNLI